MIYQGDVLRITDAEVGAQWKFGMLRDVGQRILQGGF